MFNPSSGNPTRRASLFKVESRSTSANGFAMIHITVSAEFKVECERDSRFPVE